ncbi:YqaA family protein [Leucothrix mucor]|jgi:membrane protein YqaA with SNARE-associated domain|uniref:YqaA family protein n=1 Tax=Leucothrix mucor TaxID=45248 RepID=UPI0003B62E7E|nr:YqaA family protein [Leucothrix mucor]
MKLFSNIYKKVIELAKHRNAEYYLGGLSFAESSFFPIPPDVMLMPMSLARPDRWIRYALLTTIASVLGGVAGYLIGMWAFEWLESILTTGGYEDRFEQAKNLFSTWGVWAVLAAGFSPIPYKLFTITAGLLSMAFIPFLIASAIGRGARFFLVAGLVAKAGPTMEPTILKYIEWLGWLVVGLLIMIIIFTQV